MTGQLALHVDTEHHDRAGAGQARSHAGEGAGPCTTPAPSQARFRPTRRRLRSGRTVFIHPCRECGATACHGHGCNLLVDPPQPGDWYCAGCNP